MDGVVYLFDNSCMTYPCTATPHFYCEAVADKQTGEYVDYSGYFRASSVEPLDHIKMTLDEDDIDPSVDEHTAWNEARCLASEYV